MKNMEEHLREMHELEVIDWLWHTREWKESRRSPGSPASCWVDSGTLLRSRIQKEEQEVNVCVLNLLNRNGLWNIHVERLSAHPSVCQSFCCFTSCYQATKLGIPGFHVCLPSIRRAVQTKNLLFRVPSTSPCSLWQTRFSHFFPLSLEYY